MAGRAAARASAGRRRAEEAQRKSEERLRSTLDSMMEGCQIIDFDWRYLYVNDAAAGHGRRTKEELLGHTLMEMYSGIEQTEMFAHLQRSMEERVPNRTENEFTYPDGNKAWFELSMQPVPEGIVILSQDITERKRVAEMRVKRTRLAELGAELWLGHDIQGESVEGAALARLTEGFRTHLDSAAWGVLVLEGEQPALDIFLCKKFCAKQIAQLTEDIILAVNAVRAAPLAKDAVVISIHGDDRVLRDVGPIQAQILLPLVVRGKTTGLAFIFSDRSDDYSSEEVLLFSMLAHQLAVTLENARLFHEMTALDRMKSEFVAVASHELRTPAHNIRGFARLLLDGKARDAETQRDFLSIVDEQSGHLSRLVSDILEVSRIDASSMQMDRDTVRVFELVEGTVAQFKNAAEEKAITIEIVVPRGLPAVQGDRERLGQVLTNLVSNAIKFSPERTTVTVRARVDGDDLTVDVQDQGIGIPGEALPRLFDRFYQVNGSATRTEGGSGLGLYISRSIVAAHGGRISVDSKVNQGSTFSFALPLKVSRQEMR